MASAQPPWQLPMTKGLPSLSGCSSLTLLRKTYSARLTLSMVWLGTGCGKNMMK